jgi:Zn-finger nucleic acid-binding protein
MRKLCQAPYEGRACGEPMEQVVRNGVTIDICKYDGAIFLDPGELEKLLAADRGGRGQESRPRREHHTRSHTVVHHGGHGHGHHRESFDVEEFVDEFTEDWGGDGGYSED